MKRLKQQFQSAQVMLQGADPEQRRNALEILRQIMAEAGGTTLANEAREILERAENPWRDERDPELEKYARRWDEAQARGLTDPRLIRLLKELQNQPSIATRLRPSVVRDIRKWIEIVLPQITEGMPAQDQDTLNSFVKAVSQIEAYRVVELKQLRKSLFQLRYQDLRQQIDDAIERWAIDEAWQLREELVPTPDGFETDVLRIQERIYEVEQLRQLVEESLNQLPRVSSGDWPATWPETWPETWTDLRLLVNLFRNYTGYLTGARLPKHWREKVEDGLKQGTSAAMTFLERQAASAVTLKDLQEFWGRYNELDLADADGLLVSQEGWFHGSLNSIVEKVGLDVAKADSPAALLDVSPKLVERSNGLPPFVIGRMKDLAEEIRTVAANWQAMSSGDEFEPLVEKQSALPIPETLRKAEPEFRQRLDQINAAFARVKGGAAPGEDVYREGLRIADQILARFKDHRGAEKLKKEAERGILCRRLDEALRRWQVSEFLGLCQTAAPEGVYRDLALNETALRDLAKLASRDGFSGWREAAEWWESWRDKKRTLPQLKSDLPDSLKQAVREQEALHRDHWYDTLEVLVRSELVPEEAQAAAESLGSELQALNLQGYRQALGRKAAVGRAQRHIEERLFDKAREEIAGLDEDDEDVLRLRTRLNVAEAKTRSVGELADVLFREWQNVARYLPDAHSILLITVREAWEDEQTEALKNLKMVLDRAGSAGVSGPAELDPLREWAEWLRVEQAIRANQSLLSVKQMADYLRRAESNKSALHKRRLKRLARYWEADGDNVMLAWAYQAFNRFDPSIFPAARDPVEDLIIEGSRLAERLLGELRSISAKNPDGDRKAQREVRGIISELQNHAGKWKELHNYLDWLHYKDNRRKPAPEFTQTLEKSESLLRALDSLDWLRESDWRRDETLSRVEATRRDVAGQFNGFASQARLLAQLEEWAPLTQLNFLEARLTETAEKCGSDSHLEVYEERHFDDLRHWIAEIIKVLTQTGADSWKMWRIASTEYCDLVYNKAGILLAPIEPPDLHELAGCVERLSKEEQEFKQIIEELTEHRPNVLAHGSFDPQRHLDYLQRFPTQPPGSRKVYRRFDRFATGEPIRTILKQSRESQAYLPDWVRKYLDEGMP